MAGALDPAGKDQEMTDKKLRSGYDEVCDCSNCEHVTSNPPADYRKVEALTRDMATQLMVQDRG